MKGIKRNLAGWLPSSLRGRFVVIMIAGVLAAQAASYALWTSQVRASQLEQLDELSSNMAFSIASTMRFFRSLPVDYRHIVLDQLRSMGGTRFFVSVNERRIHVEDIGSGPEKEVVVDNVRSILTQQLSIDDVVVEFSRPESLRVFNNEVLLYDLPPPLGAAQSVNGAAFASYLSGATGVGSGYLALRGHTTGRPGYF